MAATERLIIKDGAPPRQNDGSVGCVMHVVSGGNDEIQWFEYKTAFFAPINRIEWEQDTMSVVLPADSAEALIRLGYARPMKASEAKAYNESLEVVPYAASAASDGRQKEKQKETEK